MKAVVIVPGFSESRVHFSRLISALKTDGYRVKVVHSWRRQKLDKLNDSETVFVAHSMGTYYAQKYNLKPALLVGIIEPSLFRKNYFKTMRQILMQSLSTKDTLFHLKLRIASVVNGIRYIIHYLIYGLSILFKEPFEREVEDVVIVSNRGDDFSIADEVSYDEPGHHDDILYHPKRYVAHIEQLFELLPK